MTDFRNGDVFGEYQYLKHKVDFKVRADRKVIHFFEQPDRGVADILAQKYSLNTVSFGASYPFNNAARLSFNPFLASASFNNQSPSALVGNPTALGLAPNSSSSYAGFKTEFVYDNSKIFGLNLYEGIRGKASFTNYAGLSNSEQSFSKFQVDLRYYKRVFRDITFAVRGFYNGFYGKNRQVNLLGGIDNVILRGEDPVRRVGEDGIPPDYPFILSNQTDNSDILFTEIVTNFRGFDYGEITGNNALLINSELRIPLFKVLSDGPIASNFLRNFQLVGFYDFGTAWSVFA